MALRLVSSLLLGAYDKMSVSGFTQNSSSPVTSTSPATSSSHQPPTKVLKAFEDADSDVVSAKPLVESTDDELTENVVPAVPNVKEQGEAPHDLHSLNDDEGGAHDADNFVPNSDRQSTLEGGGNGAHVPAVPVHVKPEVFEIGTDDVEEKVADEALPEESRLERHYQKQSKKRSRSLRLRALLRRSARNLVHPLQAQCTSFLQNLLM